MLFSRHLKYKQKLLYTVNYHGRLHKRFRYVIKLPMYHSKAELLILNEHDDSWTLKLYSIFRYNKMWDKNSVKKKFFMSPLQPQKRKKRGINNDISTI